jgi:hypothetical protein
MRIVTGYWSDEQRRNEENWLRPFGFHPSTQGPRAGDLGLRRKTAHTSLSSLCLEPPNPADSASSPTPRTKTRPRGPRCLGGFSLATPSA